MHARQSMLRNGQLKNELKRNFAEIDDALDACFKNHVATAKKELGS